MTLDSIRSSAARSIWASLCAVMLCGTIALWCQTVRANTGDEKSEIQKLLDENANLTKQLAKNESDEGQIASAKLALEGNDVALKHAEEALKHTELGLEDELKQLEVQKKKTLNNGCPWGGKTANESYRQACNAELDQVIALAEKYENKELTAEQLKQELQTRREKLTDATVKLSKKEKINKSDARILEAARQNWFGRYRAFVFDSEAYRRLKVMAPRSQVCAGSASLEAAKACLDRLWEGSR